jgi:hypothetical protein
MHPLSITSVTEDSYHFSFTTAGGIVGFIFPFEGSEASSNEFLSNLMFWHFRRPVFLA